jgi:glycosyltransferase involved in cell wall biosynthesis
VDEVREAVKQELLSQKYDLIHAETFYMMPNIPETAIPVLLVEQTIEYLGYQSYARGSKFWFLKPLFLIDIFKIRWWEEFFWRTCSRLVVMCEEDKTYLQRTAQGIQNINVVANGVDVEYFQQTKKSLPKNPTVLFVGTFKWLPNVEAVKFLVHDVWPKILQALPSATLHIVGSSPQKKSLL